MDDAENYLGTVKMVRRWLLAAERELRQVATPPLPRPEEDRPPSRRIYERGHL